MKHFFFFFFPGRTGQNTMNRERIINVYCPVPEDLEILQLCSNLSSLLLLCMNTEKYKPERSFFFCAWGYIDLDYPSERCISPGIHIFFLSLGHFLRSIVCRYTTLPVPLRFS